MTVARAGVLYTPELLTLTVELARYPFDDTALLSAEVRSRSCGSTLALSCSTDGDGALQSLGMRVAACAVGQAAAAIFAAAAEGRSLASLEQSLADVARWLGGERERPDWPRLAALDAAVHFAGRHEAILLPWRAATAALSKQDTPD